MKNVYEASLERINYAFDRFDNVLLSFSGGKDSGVILNLCLEVAKARNELEKLAIYFIDYEADFLQTFDYVEWVFNELPAEVRKFWQCLPLRARYGLSMKAKLWMPWDVEKKALWCREIPKKDYVFSEENPLEGMDFERGMLWRKTRGNFAKWFVNQYGSTASLVGIRAEESLNRRRVITGRRVNLYENKRWSKKTGEGLVAFYPVIDWKTKDIWLAHHRGGWRYNHVYNLMLWYGIPPLEMRIANPFNEWGVASLEWFKVLSPSMWEKMVERVDGANFASIYGKTEAFAYGGAVKPKHLTWKEYAEYLCKEFGVTPKEGLSDRTICTQILKHDFNFERVSVNDDLRKQERREKTRRKYEEF